jgi:hypothetical protein
MDAFGPTWSFYMPGAAASLAFGVFNDAAVPTSGSIGVTLIVVGLGLLHSGSK